VKVNAKEIGGIVVMEVEGEVDAEHAPNLKRALIKAKESVEKGLVMDLTKVSFIDSTGLGVLISLMRQMKEQGSELRLTGMQDEVRSIFEITRLYKVFSLSESVEAAVQEIQKNAKG